MSLKFPFAVSFSVLFITIQYAIFRKSFRKFYVSLYINMSMYKIHLIHTYKWYYANVAFPHTNGAMRRLLFLVS